MIITQNTKLLSRLFKLARSVRNVQIRFDTNSLQVLLCNEQSHNCFKARIPHILSTIMVAILFLQCRLDNGSTPLEIILGWISLAILIGCQCCLVEMKRKPTEIRDFINALLQLDFIFKEETENRRMPLVHKINLAAVYALIMTAIVLPIGFVYIFHWENPCKSTLVGYWAIWKCYTSNEAADMIPPFADLLSQFLVILLNHWLWSFSLHGAVFCVGLMQILGTISIQQLIQRLEFCFKFFINLPPFTKWLLSYFYFQVYPKM